MFIFFLYIQKANMHNFVMNEWNSIELSGASNDRSLAIQNETAVVENIASTGRPTDAEVMHKLVTSNFTEHRKPSGVLLPEG